MSTRTPRHSLGGINAMFKSTELQRQWGLHTTHPPMRKMSILSRHQSPPVGFTPLTGTQIRLGCDILHSDFLPGTLTRLTRSIKAHLSEVHKTDKQTRRLTTSILYLLGVRVPIWETPLPWHILQQARYLRATPNLRRKTLPHRPLDRGPVGPRVNLFKGLSILRPGDEHYAIHSQLHFEKQMAAIRLYDASRMGPYEQDSIHRPTLRETSMRRIKHLARTETLRDHWNRTRQIQNGWQDLENPA